MPLLPRLTAWLIPILLLALATHGPPSAPSDAPEARHVTTALSGTSPGPFFDLGAAEGAERQRLEREEAEALAAEKAARVEAERLAEVARQAAVRSAPSAPQTPSPPRSTGCGYELLIRQTWPASEGDTAVRVAMRESGCTNTARNPSGASGLFQLMMPGWQGLLENVCADMAEPGKSLERVPRDQWWVDADCNVRGAFALWQGSGWGPWGGA